MKIPKVFTVFLAAITALMLGGFAANDIRQDMVKLDKVYIAALALTSQGKITESRAAVNDLQKTWRGFKDSHYNAGGRDPQWKPDLDRVDGYVDAAVKIIGTERNISLAHEPLEHVRQVMMQLRLRNRIEYFIDGLTAFHEPMETIVLAAKDKSGATLTDADMSRIRDTLPQAERAWQRVTAAKFDATDYLLTTAQIDDARKLIAIESGALAALKEALAAGDKARIAQAAVAIKPNFAKLFMTFGEFKPYGN